MTIDGQHKVDQPGEHTMKHFIVALALAMSLLSVAPAFAAGYQFAPPNQNEGSNN
jgi:hypothetical protein